MNGSPASPFKKSIEIKILNTTEEADEPSEYEFVNEKRETRKFGPAT